MKKKSVKDYPIRSAAETRKLANITRLQSIEATIENALWNGHIEVCVNVNDSILNILKAKGYKYNDLTKTLSW